MAAVEDAVRGRGAFGLRWRPMPVLWLLCIVYGAAGILTLANISRATMTGVAVLAPLGVVEIVLALGLWRRRRWALWCAAALEVALCALFVWRFLEPPLPEVCAPMPGQAIVDDFRLQALLTARALLSLLIVLYLVSRRPWFRREAAHPRVASVCGVLTVLVVALVGGAVAFVVNVDDRLAPHPELDRQFRAVAPDENGAPLLAELDLRLRDLGLDRHYGRIEPRDPDLLAWAAEADDRLDPVRGRIGPVDDILARPDVVLGAVPEGALDQRTVYRKVSRAIDFLETVAVVDAVRGRPDQALAEAVKAVRLARRVINAQGETWMIWETMHTEREAYDTVYEVLLHSEPSPDALRAALRDLPGDEGLRDAYRDFVSAQHIECIQMREDMKQFRFDCGRPPLESLLKPLLPALWRDPMPWLKRNMSTNTEAELFDRFREAADKPYHRSSRRRHGLERGVDLTPLLWVRNPVGCRFVMTTVGPVLGPYDDMFDLMSKARAARVLAALRLHHRERGALPASLADLAPDYLAEPPIDPATNKPYGYMPEAEPPILFSSGTDGRWTTRPDAGRDTWDMLLRLDFAAGRAPVSVTHPQPADMAPLEYLAHLTTEHRIAHCSYIHSVPQGWVTEADLPALMALIDVGRPCMRPVNSYSSPHADMGTPSTIGAQAALMIRSFRGDRYPAPLGTRVSEADRDELRAWWQARQAAE